MNIGVSVRPQATPSKEHRAVSNPEPEGKKIPNVLAPISSAGPIITVDELFHLLGKRAPTIKTCYQLLRHSSNLSVLELGTTRSFRSGSIELNEYDPRVSNWDWGAGCFTATIMILLPTANLTSVDPNYEAIQVSRTLTTAIGAQVNYFQTDSTNFLKSTEETFDLIYMDHAEAGTSDACGILHREDASIIKTRNLVKKDGLILIDDTPGRLGKGMYSIPYLADSGFTQISYGSYQALFRRDY